MQKTFSYIKYCLLTLLFTVPAIAQPLPSAETLLDKSIAFHDPDGQWYAGNHRLDVLSRRPSGDDRQTMVLLNHADAMFGVNMERDGKKIAAMLKAEGECDASVDGSEEISDDDREKYRLTCEGLTRLRDYHGYMLGLPMNLKDPGAILDPVAKEVDFEGTKVIALKVTYTEEVGSDTWYFYLNPENYALIGCRFYHDESKNDGEYLTFEGLASHNNIKLPKLRKWYYNNNSEFLGEDEIMSVE